MMTTLQVLLIAVVFLHLYGRKGYMCRVIICNPGLWSKATLVTSLVVQSVLEPLSIIIFTHLHFLSSPLCNCISVLGHFPSNAERSLQIIPRANSINMRQCTDVQTRIKYTNLFYRKTRGSNGCLNRKHV